MSTGTIASQIKAEKTSNTLLLRVVEVQVVVRVIVDIIVGKIINGALHRQSSMGNLAGVGIIAVLIRKSL